MIVAFTRVPFAVIHINACGFCRKSADSVHVYARAFAVIRGHAAKDERRWGSSLTIIRALNEMDAVAVSQLPVDPCERARGGLLNTSWAAWINAWRMLYSGHGLQVRREGT